MDFSKMDQRMLWWLATLGYEIAGQPMAVIKEMFLREARQWEITPEALVGMLQEDYPMPEGPVRLPEAQPS